MEKLIQELKDSWDEFTAIRHHIHQYPDRTSQERDTAEFIMGCLRKEGIPYRSEVGGHGIIAEVCGSSEVPVVALRAELDALEIQEETGLPYASKRPGLMHACGHDIHMSALLSAALILNRHKDALKGKVKFFFQPAEENGPVGGAEPMISDGALSERVDAIFAPHVMPGISFGKIATMKGPSMAAVDNFIIKVKGKGGHAALPDECIDPIVAASELVVALQSIVSRSVSPQESGVITVGSIHGGNRRNVIPDEVVMEGTMRSLSTHTRMLLRTRTEEVCKGIESLTGTKVEIIWKYSYDVTLNDVSMGNLVDRAVEKHLGSDAVDYSQKARMTAEDFGCFLKRVPGALFWVGIDKDKAMSLHSSTLCLEDDVLEITIRAFLAIVKEFFEEV